MQNNSRVFIRNRSLLPFLLIGGFTTAVVLRVAVGGMNVANSAVAGLSFAALLGLLCLIGGLHTVLSWRVLLIGLCGAIILLFVPTTRVIVHPVQSWPAGNYFSWAIVVSVVAVAEEAFLRGTLYDLIASKYREETAIVICALPFAGLHIPLYGWSAVPLDIIVGIWLGTLRLAGGSWLAPGIAHVFADLISWWLI